MLYDFDYPKGFGPDNSLDLDISKSFMVDIPSGYKGIFYSQIDGDEPEWQQAICVYSMFSGAKVLEFGNYSRRNQTAVEIVNKSNQIYSYLITGWHKSSPPRAEVSWEQTGNYSTTYTLYTDVTHIDILFNGYGLENIPFLKNEVYFEIVNGN